MKTVQELYDKIGGLRAGSILVDDQGRQLSIEVGRSLPHDTGYYVIVRVSVGERVVRQLEPPAPIIDFDKYNGVKR